MSVDLEAKIKKLGKVELRKGFKDSLRRDLMLQVSLNKPEKARLEARQVRGFVFSFPRINSGVNLLKHAYAPAVLGIFLFFSCGTVLAMKAAGSMPGDFLYNVKRASEKAQVGLTLSQTSKVNKEVGLASKRIEELTKLTTPKVTDEEENEQEEIKPEAIEKAVQDFHKEIASVKTRLDSLDRKGDGKATEAAKVIDERTEEFASALSEVAQKEELSPQVKERIVNAINILDEVSGQALGVIIKAEDEGGDGFEALVARLEARILAVEESIENVDNVVVGKGLVEDEQGVLLSLEKKIELAKIILAEARESLNDEDLEMTLQKLEESKELALEVDIEIGNTPFGAAQGLREIEKLRDEDLNVDEEEVAEPQDTRIQDTRIQINSKSQISNDEDGEVDELETSKLETSDDEDVGDANEMNETNVTNDDASEDVDEEIETEEEDEVEDDEGDIDAGLIMTE